MKLAQQLFRNHTLGLLFFIYFFLRLIFIHSLPIFNDEAIYLDWGWRELHQPGAFFYSLYDGKQPLLMWIFGVFQILFSDQLFAGRLVSVIAGGLTLWGVYTIADKYLSKKVATLSAIFYIGIPIFSSYDRLALMESAVAACGVWSLYFFLKIIETEKKKYALLAGVILGIGFFIKSSMAVFGLVEVGFLTYLSIKNSKTRAFFYGNVGILLFSALLVDTLLFLQPLYWQTLSMNERYSLTLTEIFHLPIIHFLSNMWANITILAVFYTLPIALLGFVGCYFFLKGKPLERIMSLWFISVLIIQAFLVRGTTQRYLVSFLPILCVFAAYSFFKLFKTKVSRTLGAVICLGVIFSLTFLQLVNPFQYNWILGKVTTQSDMGMILGQTSGYGITDIENKLNILSQGRPVFVGMALNAGNPEDAILTAFHKSDFIKVGYFAKRLFPPTLSTYNCIQSDVPLYFVSRDEQQAEMNIYFENIYRVYHPSSNYSIGIYRLKSNCKGNTLTISPLGPQL